MNGVIRNARTARLRADGSFSYTERGRATIKGLGRGLFRIVVSGRVKRRVATGDFTLRQSAGGGPAAAAGLRSGCRGADGRATARAARRPRGPRATALEGQRGQAATAGAAITGRRPPAVPRGHGRRQPSRPPAALRAIL